MLARTFALVALTLAAPAFADDPPAPSAPSAMPALEAPPPVVVAPEMVIDAPPPLRTGPPPAVVRTGLVERPVPEVEAPRAAATPERVSIEVFARRQHVGDGNFALFSDNAALGLGGIAVRAPVYSEGPWTLSAQASIEGHEALVGAARGAKLSVDLSRAVGRAELAYAIYPQLSALGAAGFGGEVADFRYVGSNAEEGHLKTWSSFGELAAGLDAHVRLGSVLVGARLEGGFVAAAAHDLKATLPDVGDVVRQPIDFGTLSFNGAFSRFALHLGF